MDYPTLTVVKALLESRQLAPRKRFGQNFLIEANIARKSLELAEITPGDTVVEIGPGLGALSQLLLQAGCQVYAIEMDSGFFRYLEEVVLPEYPQHFNLKHGDAMDAPLAEVPTEDKPFKIVANLPYAISTPWLDAVLSGPLPSRMVIMLQKEAANRFIAASDSGNYGPISIFLKSAYDVEAVHKVSANCFYPKPEVGSALLSIKIKDSPILFSKTIKDGIRQIFRQRRKQISSIIPKIDAAGLFLPWLEDLIANGLKPTTRPESIKIEDWQKLAKNQVLDLPIA
ncbi:MAG: 16S rRNA (adenine(1518)-N(6)/adenine(1519)-N(6))-dimethyltransferase RsmA [Verrucomicrobia bacterium]|nr:16S rRNA (adenine(1518)-N(6)/adenine(1519)-N(6))-dimethyltransferase RsmA [Verrucomicrobiota bacterium]MDA1066098.1 16S rRNA (adenine(1518)-N(6)/adenine(1519)-N(6))-dimethyltransferase RsmA [Verrucomicrobiota bacterium]